MQVSTTWALACPETVHQRPCVTREIETWLSDSGVGNSSVVDHRSRQMSCLTILGVEMQAVEVDAQRHQHTQVTSCHSTGSQRPHCCCSCISRCICYVSIGGTPAHESVFHAIKCLLFNISFYFSSVAFHFLCSPCFFLVSPSPIFFAAFDFFVIARILVMLFSL